MRCMSLVDNVMPAQIASEKTKASCINWIVFSGWQVAAYESSAELNMTRLNEQCPLPAGHGFDDWGHVRLVCSFHATQTYWFSTFGLARGLDPIVLLRLVLLFHVDAFLESCHTAASKWSILPWFQFQLRSWSSCRRTTTSGSCSSR